MAWQDDRACAGVSLEAFFPRNGNWQRSRKICRSCPVRAECLDAELRAMAGGAATEGMFGGLTPQQRELLVGTRRPRSVA
ncbi:MAG TPA: WhiB family transcriptional regulator [Acidimicrobiia bacterium]|jgi:WhiB family redox-sensing transcriptional regulator